MQFNSTTYLVFNLRDKLKLDQNDIKKYVRFLNGFFIKPGSMKYNEDGKALTFSMSLPDNEEVLYGVTINSNGEIMISFSIRDIIINILCKTYVPEMSYSILIEDENNHNSGIYYYRTKAFAPHTGRYKGQYTFYDAVTLKTIRDSSDLVLSANGLVDLIGTSPEKIDNMGFVPDITKWENESSGEKGGGEAIDDINNKIRAINYDSIMGLLSTFTENYESVNAPVFFERN